MLSLLGVVLNPDRFAGNAARVALGVTVGQGVVVFSYPIITRLYAPRDVGVLAVFASLLAMLGGVVCLRYEEAIPLTTSDDDAIRMLHLAVAAALGVSFGTGLVLVWGRSWIGGSLGADESGSALVVLPMALLLVGLAQAFGAVVIRQRRYSLIAYGSASQGLTQAASQVGFGVLGWGALGLVLGDTLGWGAQLITLTRGTRFRLSGGQKDAGRTRALARRYRRFPIFAAPAGLVSTVGQQIPTVLVAILYGTADAGLFALAQAVMAVPLTFLGDAVNRVYVGEATRVRREQHRRMLPLVLKTTRGLLVVGFPFMLATALLAPFLFGIIFGPQWNEAGHLTRVLVVGYFAQLVVSPIGATVNIMERQSWQLSWDLVRLILVVSSVFVAHALGWGLMGAAFSLSCAMVVSYVLLFAISYLAAGRGEIGVPR